VNEWGGDAHLGGFTTWVAGFGSPVGDASLPSADDRRRGRGVAASRSALLPMIPFVPSVSRTKPLVTTRSPTARPLLTTVCISSCFCTTIGRIAAVLSALTTYTKVPLGPRCTALVGTVTTFFSVSIKSRILTN